MWEARTRTVVVGALGAFVAVTINMETDLKEEGYIWAPGLRCLSPRQQPPVL